jgi:hypothetical protein
MNQDQINKRKGLFTASRMSDLLAAGEGKSRNSYIFDVAASVFDCSPSVDTAAMRHGIINQHNAFRLVVQPKWHDAVWYDDLILYNDNIGASPDIILADNVPMDVKCPTSIDNYSNSIWQYNALNTDESNAAYYIQSQTQMLATGTDTGHLLFYLTKFESYMDTDWREYAVPLDDRYAIVTFEKNNATQDRILNAVETAAVRRDRLIECMTEATTMDDEEYFYTQTKFNSLIPAKRASNHLNIKYIRIGNKFYCKK